MKDVFGEYSQKIYNCLINWIVWVSLDFDKADFRFLRCIYRPNHILLMFTVHFIEVLETNILNIRMNTQTLPLKALIPCNQFTKHIHIRYFTYSKQQSFKGAVF